MTAMFAGKFDPVTTGHINIIERTAAMFDRLYVVAFNNADKAARFTIEHRTALLRRACAGITNVTVDSSEGMVADYAAAHNVAVLVRGVRNADDLAYEMEMAHNNRHIYGNIETIFLPAEKGLEGVSSTVVRRLLESEQDAG